MKKALILVDLQNDFMPGGALAVAHADQVIAVANELIPQFEIVVATQDWHPANHQSFAAEHPGRQPGELIDLHGLAQVLWPVHCVQGSQGAAFVEGLHQEAITHVAQKGMDPKVDSYSGFFDNGHRHDTGLSQWLKDRQVTELTILGVATDYCVQFTVLDALKEGFHVSLVEQGCRGVNLNATDSEDAMDAMRKAGAKVI